MKHDDEKKPKSELVAAATESAPEAETSNVKTS